MKARKLTPGEFQRLIKRQQRAINELQAYFEARNWVLVTAYADEVHRRAIKMQMQSALTP